jgi:GH24 family phage-related lysozyme (muramidase)
MEQKTNKLKHFTEDFRTFMEGRVKDEMLKARERPAIAITKKARAESATKTHGAIQSALKSGKIVTIRARTVPDFEAPAVDHNLVVHQGALMMVDPKGMAREVSQMVPSDSGHIAVNFKEKNRRAGRTMYLHAGHESEGDMIETEVERSPYRVSMVGGRRQFRGLPDLSEESTTDTVRIMNLLEQRLKKKDWARGVLGGLAVAGSVIGAHQATRPTFQQVTPAVAKIGSGQVVAKTREEKPTSSAHLLASQIIREREGFEPTAYNKDGTWTVGLGTTRWSSGKPVKQGDTITREQAHKEHEHHIHNVVIPKMEKTVPHWDKMNDHQKAAVISFSYNVGENFMKNKNYEKIQDALSHPDNWNKVPGTMALYNKAHNPETGRKEVLRGLVTRRKMEGGLWSKPVN